MATPITDAKRLFVHQLRSMLWVELKLAEEVLPEILDAVFATDLKWAIERHLHETTGHVESIRRAFELLQEPGEPEPSPALVGLRRECDQLLKQMDSSEHALVDLFHAGVVARTEHEEIGAYGGLVHTAQALGHPEVALLLRRNMEEDMHALEQAEHALAKLLAEKVENAPA